MWYLVDETFRHESAEEIADGIIRKKKENLWRLERAFIDPLSKGDNKDNKSRGTGIDNSFNIILRKLAEDNIRLEVASKDKASGILNVERMLMGPNKMPSLFFFRTTVNAFRYDGHGEGTVWEIQHWVYRDGEPEKESDHFCENLYRLTLTGVKYTDPRIARIPVVEEHYNPLTFGLEVRV
jgi:hypothetical protein